MANEGQDDALQVNPPASQPTSSRGDELEPAITRRDIEKPDTTAGEIQALRQRVDRLGLYCRGLLFLSVVICVASVTALYLVRGDRSSAAQAAPPPAQHPAEAQHQAPGTVEVREIVFVTAAGERKESIRLADTGGLAFCDSAGRTRVLWFNNPEGDVGWNFLTTDGRQRVSLGVLKNGVGDMSVTDEGNKHILSLRAEGVVLYEGRRSRGQFLLVDGQAGISIFDQQGRSRIGMGMTAQGPTIDVSDEKGAVLFKKP